MNVCKCHRRLRWEGHMHLVGEDSSAVDTRCPILEGYSLQIRTYVYLIPTFERVIIQTKMAFFTISISPQTQADFPASKPTRILAKWSFARSRMYTKRHTATPCQCVRYESTSRSYDVKYRYMILPTFFRIESVSNENRHFFPRFVWRPVPVFLP